MIRLKYGGKEIEFRKSDTYLGVKAHDNGQEVLDEHLGQSKLGLAARSLGGFDIVATPDDVDVDEQLNDLRGRPEVSHGTHIWQQSDNPAPLVPTGELYIVFKNGAKHKACLDLLNKYGLRISEVRGKREVVAKTTPLSPNPIKAAALLQEADDLVDICEPNLAYHIHQYALPLPQDQYFLSQWYLKNSGTAPDGSTFGLKPGADVKVIEAWEELGNMGSPNIIVSIVDDGFDLNHPDFQGKIVAPFDFEKKSSDNLLLRADDTHGTNCAGLAIAANNGSGVVGAAANARFMPVRIFGVDDQIIERLCDYHIENGADVVSNSWGIPGKILSTRIINAYAKLASKGRKGRGTVVLFAAGNEGATVTGYATHPNVICVGACSSLDQFSSYSNKGPEVSVVASSNGDGGLGVVTTDAGSVLDESGKRIDAGQEGLYRDNFGGTSSAAPLAAGVCALILSANPNLTAAQVKHILESTADKIGGPNEYDANGHSIKYGYGRINAARAVRKAKSLIGQTDQMPVEEMPALLLRSTIKGNLPAQNTGKLFQLTVGNQLILQSKPLAGGLEIDMFIKRGTPPVPAKGTFDKRSNIQNGVNFIVENAAQLTDYYVGVYAKSGAGSYGLQVTMGGMGKIPNPMTTAQYGGIQTMRFQSLASGKFNSPGELHLFRISLSQRLVFQLDGPDDNTRDFDLYVRKDEIPEPQGHQYDESSTEVDTSDESIVLESTAAIMADYYLLVRSVKGGGEFGLTVQLG